MTSTGWLFISSFGSWNHYGPPRISTGRKLEDSRKEEYLPLFFCSQVPSLPVPTQQAKAWMPSSDNIVFSLVPLAWNMVTSSPVSRLPHHSMSLSSSIFQVSNSCIKFLLLESSIDADDPTGICLVHIVTGLKLLCVAVAYCFTTWRVDDMVSSWPEKRLGQ